MKTTKKRMKVIIVGCNKGGTAKTTSATGLAVVLAQKGNKVYLLDADKQNSASNWAAERERIEAKPVITVSSRRGAIAGHIKSISDDYDYCIVDVSGSISPELVSALPVADLLVAPYKCSQYDLDTLTELETQVNFIKDSTGYAPDVLIYHTMASTNHVIRGRERASFEACASEFPTFKLMKSVNSHRQAFIDTAENGLAVTEMTNAKAKKELLAFAEEVLTHG
jgi:chromosome partitioning protein